MQFRESIIHNDLLKTQFSLSDPDIDPSFDNNWAILYAAKNGYTYIVELLLNNENINFFDENLVWVIKHPSQNGDIETIKAIINNKRFDITEHIASGIISAAENGYVDIVELFLSDDRLNPLQSHSWAITQANKLKHYNVVTLLWRKTNVKDTLKNDNINLYNKLIQEDIQNKVSKF